MNVFGKIIELTLRLASEELKWRTIGRCVDPCGMYPLSISTDSGPALVERTLGKAGSVRQSGNLLFNNAMDDSLLRLKMPGAAECHVGLARVRPLTRLRRDA